MNFVILGNVALNLSRVTSIKREEQQGVVAVLVVSDGQSQWFQGDKAIALWNYIFKNSLRLPVRPGVALIDDATKGGNA